MIKITDIINEIEFEEYGPLGEFTREELFRIGAEVRLGLNHINKYLYQVTYEPIYRTVASSLLEVGWYPYRKTTALTPTMERQLLDFYHNKYVKIKDYDGGVWVVRFFTKYGKIIHRTDHAGAQALSKKGWKLALYVDRPRRPGA